MKPDNVTGSPMNPQNWNLYSYVHSNPVNFNDPTGHDGEETEAKLPEGGGDPNATSQAQQQIQEEQTGNKDENGPPTDLISSLAGVYESIANFFESAGNTISSAGESLNNGNVAGIVAGTTLSTIGDMVSGMGDMFRVGSATGEAIGSGKSGEAIVSSVAMDVGRGSTLALTMAMPAKAARVAKGNNQFTKYGSTPENKIYTKHGAIQADARGIPGSVTDAVINNNKAIPGKNGTLIYYDSQNNVTVVTGKNGSIVTVHKGKP